MIPTGPVTNQEVRDLPKKILAPSLPAVPDTEEEEALEEPGAVGANTVPVPMAQPLNPQQVRQHEIAFDVSRELAPDNQRLQLLLIKAVDRAFVLDNAEREEIGLCGSTDAEFTEIKLGLRDGTIKLDTSWIE